MGKVAGALPLDLRDLERFLEDILSKLRPKGRTEMKQRKDTENMTKKLEKHEKWPKVVIKHGVFKGM